MTKLTKENLDKLLTTEKLSIKSFNYEDTSKSVHSNKYNENHSVESLNYEDTSKSVHSNKSNKSNENKLIEEALQPWEDKIKEKIITEHNSTNKTFNAVAYPITTLLGTLLKTSEIAALSVMQLFLYLLTGDKEGGEFSDLMKFLKKEQDNPLITTFITRVILHSAGFCCGQNRDIAEFFKDESLLSKDNPIFSYVAAYSRAVSRDWAGWSFDNGWSSSKDIAPISISSTENEVSWTNYVQNKKEKNISDDIEPNADPENQNIKYNLVEPSLGGGPSRP
jgi:hypothetical protein